MKAVAAPDTETIAEPVKRAALTSEFNGLGVLVGDSRADIPDEAHHRQQPDHLGERERVWLR